MKKNDCFLLVFVVFSLVFISQIALVEATTRYNDYDSYDDGYLDMDCEASIWAAPKAGGGYFMDQQYFNVDIDSRTGCGIYWVHIIIYIQGDLFIDDYPVNNGLYPNWGPDSVYDDYWDYDEYYTSNYAVWASITVQVLWIRSGGSPHITTIQAEASYGA
ncbi:MAG TPA: hypothetical protein VMZ29_11615 [Candidatus Bathyarchaeia archaeon]|nr:hypothetical protein [Candidatus Bathyarchaeia archaeon]